jgi:hypothetical protein
MHMPTHSENKKGKGKKTLWTSQGNESHQEVTTTID